MFVRNPLLAVTVTVAFCLLCAGAAVAQEDEAADVTEEPAVPETIGECAPPTAVALPESASKEELRALVKVVKGYIKAGDAYIVCLTKHDATLGEDADARAHLVASHNAMVDTMQALATAFNKARKAAFEADTE